jgi:hypothetical protein
VSAATGGSKVGVDPLPEIVELEGVEKRECLLDPPGPHVQKPGVGVDVRLAVARGSLGVEKDDYGVAVAVQAADRRLAVASSARRSNGLPLPARQASKLAWTIALLLSQTAFSSSIGTG